MSAIKRLIEDYAETKGVSFEAAAALLQQPAAFTEASTAFVAKYPIPAPPVKPAKPALTVVK